MVNIPLFVGCLKCSELQDVIRGITEKCGLRVKKQLENLSVRTHMLKDVLSDTLLEEFSKDLRKTPPVEQTIFRFV